MNMEFNKQLEELNNKIENINNELEKIKVRKEEREKAINIGVISILDDRLKLELLLNSDDFSEKHIQKLTKITNDLQDLLLDVYNKEEK
jgi:hypothetical protein